MRGSFSAASIPIEPEDYAGYSVGATLLVSYSTPIEFALLIIQAYCAPQRLVSETANRK